MFDQSEFKFDEQSSMYGPRDSGPCATEKDTIERLLNTAGIFLAVSFCGVVLQARELYRSEGKQQVALFLMDLICAYHEMGVLLPIAICYDDMYGTQHAPPHPSALHHPCLPTLSLLLSLLATCAPCTRAHFTCTTGLYWLEVEFAPALLVIFHCRRVLRTQVPPARSAPVFDGRKLVGCLRSMPGPLLRRVPHGKPRDHFLPVFTQPEEVHPNCRSKHPELRANKPDGEQT